MKKRFAVAIDSMNAEDDQKLLDFVKANGYGWWHWIDNFWLLTTYNSSVTSVTLRDSLGQIIPKNKIVIEVSDGTAWAGFGPTGENKNMFSWLHDTWTKESG